MRVRCLCSFSWRAQVALIQVAIPRPHFNRSAAHSHEIISHVARINRAYGGGDNICLGPLETALKHPGPVYYIGTVMIEMFFFFFFAHSDVL